MMPFAGHPKVGGGVGDGLKALRSKVFNAEATGLLLRGSKVSRRKVRESGWLATPSC